MVPGIDEKDLSKFIVVGYRVLIQPKIPEKRTKSGLYSSGSKELKQIKLILSGKLLDKIPVCRKSIGPGYETHISSFVNDGNIEPA